MNGLRRLLSICTLKKVDDTGKTQKAQVDLGPKLPAGEHELHDDTYILGPYGVASNPPEGSFGLAAFLDGERSPGAVVGVVHSSRLKNLQPGDVALYDVRGAHLKFTEDGLEIDAGGAAVTIKNFSSCTVDGDLTVNGEVTARANGTPAKLGALRDAYVAHKHPVAGNVTLVSDHITGI